MSDEEIQKKQKGADQADLLGAKAPTGTLTHADTGRDAVIIRTSILGILSNVLLAAFKAAVGMLSNSIAITLDAVNNLSDAMSSVITIVGTKLSSRPADKKHPMGYGRIEYLSAMIISMIVLYAGIQSLVESVRKIIHPQTPSYTAVTLIIVAVAVAVKLMLGSFFIKKGRDVSSDSLSASGQDARNDAILSASTLVAAIIFIITGVSVESYLGVVISAVIIKSGIEMLRDTISEILGERVDSALAKEIKQTICGFQDVSGAYDLIMHNYGPDKMVGSVHIEIPDYYTADRIDTLTRAIAQRVYEKTGAILTGISIYSKNIGSSENSQILEDVRHIVMENPFVLQMHGFYLAKEEKKMQLDAVISFKAADRQAECAKIYEALHKKYPDYDIHVQMDSDTSD